ncbi:hypothetical protein G6F22_019616 [Rhizopus arrhizus]|nr:hypothetical protein G6F22_019616 [Rhizopus arrhizus]KAG1396131.1 hypothetical protein G6F59_013868 [Rhizopus arrhizus]
MAGAHSCAAVLPARGAGRHAAVVRGRHRADAAGGCVRAWPGGIPAGPPLLHRRVPRWTARRAWSGGCQRAAGSVCRTQCAGPVAAPAGADAHPGAGVRGGAGLDGGAGPRTAVRCCS